MGKFPDIQKLLIKNSPIKNKTHLKHRLIKEGLLENKCAWCGIGPKWKDNPLTLEMDHINGNNTDNRIENLRILCLNCHAQTPTFRRAKTHGKRRVKCTTYFRNTCVPKVLVLTGLLLLSKYMPISFN